MITPRISKISLLFLLFFGTLCLLQARGRSGKDESPGPAPVQFPPEDAGYPPAAAETLDGGPSPEDPAPDEGGESAGPSGTVPGEGDLPAGTEAAAESAAGSGAVPEMALDPAEALVLSMDIRTSTLMELAYWCRELGLSDGGTREDLVRRLQGYYRLAPDSEAAPEGRIITIESARSTEYFTLESVNEEYARLTGDVMVSLKEGETVHRIKAWEILFNRTRNILSASGGVEYVKEDGTVRETFRGESITVNLDNWSGVFMDGVSEHAAAAGETAYRFAGTLISRNEQDVTVLTRARITNAANKEALWSVEASKIWLLPGSDWAALNTVLKVGEIPVLYVPFFFYPADEITFHPVLGYRSREGSFVQTTTYILGRPKTTVSAESSLTRLMGDDSSSEKIREGIFLRSTGRPARDPGDTNFSVLLDAYTNLGIYAGTELALPQKGVFGPFNLSAGLGFTRDIYQVDSTYYTPFANYDGESSWNHSYFFSEGIPFRYRFKTSGSASGGYGSVAWEMPFYSDPYVDQDFLNRSEALDWVSMLRSGMAPGEESSLDPIGSYEWRVSGSSRISVPALAPYLTDLSISSWASAISFRTRNSASEPAGSTSPRRRFFYPDRFTIYSISASLGGTPLSLGDAPAKAAGPEEETPEAGLFGDLGVPRTPWQDTPPADPAETNDGTLQPPALSQRFDIPLSHGPRFSIDYRLNPSSSSELQFRSGDAHWREAEDINWGDISSVLFTLRTDGSVNFTLADTTPLFSNTLRFFGTAAWQDYSYMNEEAEEFDTPAERDAARRRVNSGRYFTTSWEYGATVKPFYQSAVWGNSNFQYTLRGLLVRYLFDSGADTWEADYTKWNNKNVELHRMVANLNASVMDYNQSLAITSDMYPRQPTLGGDAVIRAWITETNARGRIVDPYNDGNRIFEPLYFTETLRFAPSYSAQQYLVYDPELEEFTTLTSSLILNHFAASYSMARSVEYELVSGSGWQVKDPNDLALRPRDIRLSYAQIFRKDNVWKNRLSFSVSVNTNLTFDLQRYTYSKFTFSLGFIMSIANFLDISLTATSENSVVYRYVQDWPFFNTPEIPGEKNPFVDLFNSFRFDRDDLRKESGFKFKSFNLTMVHHLGDWNAKLGITLTPYLDNTSSLRSDWQYRLNPEISFLVQWVPAEEIKSEITYDKDQFVIK
ncbi:MAG: LPS-assembly protein LptD [Treponema sp.]|jgi:hypothetical protein|nr:LPS-assembly protein LptD [Treponema sp.]